MRGRPAAVAAVLALAVAAAGCGTGVRDEEGWKKALGKGYPCSELLDIAEDLPRSVDPAMVAADLRAAGCDPGPAGP